MANRRSFSNNDFSDCDTTGYDLLPLMSEGGNWKGIEAREKHLVAVLKQKWRLVH